ncbi:NADH-quinone oxidoreductase subunit NuoG [Geoalkalibacter sp.]|uniref:NADH-quinone oxidoreductase subunit NuoG n=1 Tax=Geoalkalibacter sp. TaxID=3041440 RepID=UPI00272DE213|nr:NADH-quinone oxidoreductase subunit NuoG [Geoalkalibacter sp.]
MPKLTIDNQSVEVPDGTNVLEAAKRLGIVIPHFCYHEALGAVGACRLCAMKFEDGPVKGIQMACMVTAQEGMVVSTLDAATVEFRAHVIEWLMMNHPHDCPVCDEGGECQLQDMTVAGGHTLRRYRGLKRTYPNQQLGPFIEHEMNRCIQCYRCARTYQDYCGGEDFGVLGTNQRVYFGRFRDGRLESPFSGNLVDVCPTGVFTDKAFRFKSRYWDLEEAPSVCPHCGLGCATIPGGRYRELQRVRAGSNRQTNGFFICDRGRFGYGHAAHAARPRVPLVDGQEVDWTQALAAARARLDKIIAAHGPRSVALLGSSRAGLEANAQLRSLARLLGTDRVVFAAHAPRDWTARTLAAGLGAQASSLDDVRRSDCLLLIGADPLAEAPLLALAVRQAVRGGARAAIIDPRPVALPCATAHLPLAPWRLGQALAALGDNDWSRFEGQEAVFLEGVHEALAGARHPIVIGGADLLGPAGMRQLLELARRLSREDRPCGAMGVLSGPNSYGAALLAGDGPDFEELSNAMITGEVRALICLESDPLTQAADPAHAGLALARLDLLVALDSLPTKTLGHAQIILPTTVTAEGAGCFVNNEGRMQTFMRVLAPGLPLRETGGGGHPPRLFMADTPGAAPRPAWEILAGLQGRAASLAELRDALAREDVRFAGLTALAAESEGQRVADAGLALPATRVEDYVPRDGELALLVCEALFGSEETAFYSAPLDPVRPEPRLILHERDAGRLGVTPGEQVRLHSAVEEVVLPVEIRADSAPGVAILPRVRGSLVEAFVPGVGPQPCRINREVDHA